MYLVPGHQLPHAHLLITLTTTCVSCPHQGINPDFDSASADVAEAQAQLQQYLKEVGGYVWIGGWGDVCVCMNRWMCVCVCVCVCDVVGGQSSYYAVGPHARVLMLRRSRTTLLRKDTSTDAQIQIHAAFRGGGVHGVQI